MCGPIDASTRSVLASCNPFEDVARPQQPDGRFSELDVRSVLRAPREQVLRAIDAYRVQELSSLLDLPPSRVVKILGYRGAGKTHLYEAILNRDDGQHQLLIRRETENFEERVSFEEYMFQLLTSALHSRHPVYGYRFFDAVAGHVARRLLLHAVRELGPTDRLFLMSPRRWQQFRLLWRGQRGQWQRFEELADALEDADTSADLRQLCVRLQLGPAMLADLAMTRLHRMEPAEDARSLIRRELYGAMIRAALLGDRQALQDFLETDYQAASPGRVLHRADVVRHLLHAMCEVCALVQLPVVYAFDNLEGLLAPAGDLQPRRVAAFVEGLAQAVDHTRGFLFLVFFEHGLFNQALQHTGTFARSRLDLGVHVPGRCRVAEIELPAPTREELYELVRGRVAPLRAQLPDGHALPAHFPFSATVIDKIGALTDQPIRGKLEMLRDEYNALVFPNGRPLTPPEPATGPPIPTPAGLERVWGEALLEAGRVMEIALADRQADLTLGLAQVLQAGLPWPERFPGCGTESESLPIGDNPRHGHATLVKCEHDPARIAVGFLLAGGRGMPLDLQSKFAAFTDERARAEHLVVLWPTATGTADAIAALPLRTREVWDEATRHHPATLRAVDKTSLRKLLAFLLLPEKARQQELPLPESTLTEFVRERCVEIFPLVLPTESH